MFQVSGRSWIALAGPIGNPERYEELAWQFREATDRHDARCVFYHVSDAELPMYVDLGLSLVKLGEEARVRSSTFNIDNSERAEMRHARNRAKRDGASFEIIPAADVPAVIDELKVVSDAWLADKKAHEKGFSLGRIRSALCRELSIAQWCACSGAIVAFATIWKSANSEELTVDLMRFTDKAPKGVMDFLFTEMLLAGEGTGLSVVQPRHGAPLRSWSAPAGDAVAQARQSAVSLRRQLLQLRRSAPLQVEIPAGMGAALPRQPRRNRTYRSADRHHGADLRRRARSVHQVESDYAAGASGWRLGCARANASSALHAASIATSFGNADRSTLNLRALNSCGTRHMSA